MVESEGILLFLISPFFINLMFPFVIIYAVSYTIFKKTALLTKNKRYSTLIFILFAISLLFIRFSVENILLILVLWFIAKRKREYVNLIMNLFTSLVVSSLFIIFESLVGFTINVIFLMILLVWILLSFSFVSNFYEIKKNKKHQIAFGIFLGNTLIVTICWSFGFPSAIAGIEIDLIVGITIFADLVGITIFILATGKEEKEMEIEKPRVPKSNEEKKIRIYIKDGQPSVDIDGEFVDLTESSFAYFALCAASKYKEEDPLSFKELYISKGRQELTPLNKQLKKFKIDIKSERGKVYSTMEEERKIYFDEKSLCKFESRHYDWITDNVVLFFKEMEQFKTDEASRKKEKAEKLLFRLGIFTSEGKKLWHCGYTVSSKLSSVIRNTELVKRTVEKMGWKFRDETWCQNWNILKSKISEMFGLVGCDFGELIN